MKNMNSKILIFLFLAVFTLVAFLPVFSNIAQASANCASSVMSFDEFKRFQSAGLVSNKAQINVGSTHATVSIFNRTNCNMPVSFVSWKMYDRNPANQVRFDSQSITIPANSSRNLSVNLPDCMAQIDAYYGSVPATPVNDKPFLLAWDFSQNNGGGLSDASGNFCRDIPPPPPPPPVCTDCNPPEEPDPDLTLTCSANTSRVDVDEDVIWRAYPNGGTGYYSYDWSGTDGLDGNSRNITWSYDDGGIKRATVTVTSGDDIVSASCTVRVDEEDDEEDLEVSCRANPTSAQVGERIRWTVDVDGGDGDYDYEWDGSNGLDSSSKSPYKTYSSVGRKSATVTVTDGDGNEESDTCYINITSVLAFSQINQAPLLDAVYLSQIPYTGANNKKTFIFFGILSLFSAWIAYIIVARKKEVGELN